MGTHPIFESDFDCLTEMEAEAWKALKQAAIRFELKTGLNVHVSACRGERPVYEFTSSGKTNTDSRLVSRQSRSKLIDQILSQCLCQSIIQHFTSQRILY